MSSATLLVLVAQSASGAESNVTPATEKDQKSLESRYKRELLASQEFVGPNVVHLVENLGLELKQACSGISYLDFARSLYNLDSSQYRCSLEALRKGGYTLLNTIKYVDPEYGNSIELKANFYNKIRRHTFNDKNQKYIEVLMKQVEIACTKYMAVFSLIFAKADKELSLENPIMHSDWFSEPLLGLMSCHLFNHAKISKTTIKDLGNFARALYKKSMEEIELSQQEKIKDQ